MIDLDVDMGIGVLLFLTDVGELLGIVVLVVDFVVCSLLS